MSFAEFCIDLHLFGNKHVQLEFFLCTMPSVPPVFALVPTTQSYDWGKTGSDSQVAQLASASNLSGFKLDEKTRYAEVSIDGDIAQSTSIMSSFGFSFGWGLTLIHHRVYCHLMKSFQSTLQLTPSSLVTVSLIVLKRQMATFPSSSKSCPSTRLLASKRTLTRKQPRSYTLNSPISTKVRTILSEYCP